MASKLFGTDGVRGRANVPPMDSDTVLSLGRAAAHVFRRSEGRHRILIGKDTRLSGYMLETALASGLVSMGVDVLLVGPLPTPGVAFMTRSMRADAGVMISASHNLYEDNGIKFFGPDGFKLPDEMELEIERLMEPGQLDQLRASPERVGKAFRIDDAVGRYTVFLKNFIERECKFDGLRLVVDSANGAAYRVAPQVFTELGATVVKVGDEPDGTNINEGCGSLYPQNLSRSVIENRAHCGVAFDGDADRVVFCDESGEVFDGDMILALLAGEMAREGRLRGGGVVGTVMSNFGLECLLVGMGLKLYRADVGDRYVLSEMLQRGMNLGGEQSGHIISLDHNTTGDGIMTALLVLSYLIKAGRPLSSYRSLFRHYPQVLLNVPVLSKPAFSDVPKIASALQDAEQRLKNKGGGKEIGAGRILLRYSGTEPKARVMVECDDATLCKSLAEELAEVVRKAIG